MWAILGNDRAVKFGGKNYFRMLFDLFHVLLKPKVIKHLQYLYEAYSFGGYPYLKAMTVLGRKLNTKGKPAEGRVSGNS